MGMSPFLTDTWFQLCPWPILQDTILRVVADYLCQPDTQRELEELERNCIYPKTIRTKLHQLGLYRFFAQMPAESLQHLHAPENRDNCARVTLVHIGALNHILAATNSTLAITVAVNALALLPVYIAATPTQLAWVFEQVQAGAYCSILLSELTHGSDLLSNHTRAVVGRLDTTEHFQPLSNTSQTDSSIHYQLSGRKDMINGGSQHELLVTLAHIRYNPMEGDDATFALDESTLFLVERNETIHSPHRWHTLPMPGADISSVEFRETIVPVDQRLGEVGNGLRIVQKTLSISRGGIASLAAGLASKALSLAVNYAKERSIYGKPLIQLGAIFEHLLHMQALELLISAMSLKAMAVSNSLGTRGVYYATVAKFSCCTLAEELVEEGRVLHGSRALITDSPYHRLVNDVLLYSTFDGTTHVVLEQIQARLFQLATATPAQVQAANGYISMMARIYQDSPQYLPTVARQPGKALLVEPEAYLCELDQVEGVISLKPLIVLVQAVYSLVCHCQRTGTWNDDQGFRLEVSKSFAHLEMLIALVEFADPTRRRVLGMPELSSSIGPLQVWYPLAFGWFGARIARSLRSLLLQVGAEPHALLDSAEQSLTQLYANKRHLIRAPCLA